MLEGGVGVETVGPKGTGRLKVGTLSMAESTDGFSK